MPPHPGNSSFPNATHSRKPWCGGTNNRHDGHDRNIDSVPLRPLPALLLAPEKYLSFWAGIALSFTAYTVTVATRLLLLHGDDERGDNSSGSSGFGVKWPFAGASIGFRRSGDGIGDGDAASHGAGAAVLENETAMNATAWAGVVCLIFLFATMGLWTSLLAGDGNAAAVAQSAQSLRCSGGKAAAPAPAVESAISTIIASITSQARRVLRACGVRQENRDERDGMIPQGMGWGDPGVVSMCPVQDMRVLVEGVSERGGPPDSRKLCRTCLVRKPIRSKVSLSWINECLHVAVSCFALGRVVIRMMEVVNLLILLSIIPSSDVKSADFFLKGIERGGGKRSNSSIQAAQEYHSVSDAYGVRATPPLSPSAL